MATIDSFSAVYNQCITTKERLENLQSEIFENMEISPFKEYLLSELSRIQMLVLDTQQCFVEGFCKDYGLKEKIVDKLEYNRETINNSLHNDSGLSL